MVYGELSFDYGACEDIIPNIEGDLEVCAVDGLTTTTRFVDGDEVVR